MNKLHRNIYITMFAIQGVIIGLVENMVPYPFTFAPGVKLGLANPITIIAIFTMCKRDSFSLICLRLILTTLLGDTFSTFFYSVSGALLSYFGMLLVKQLGSKRVSAIEISAVGDFLHNVSQLLTTFFFAHSWALMLCLPSLSLSGLFSGITIGIAASYLPQHARTSQKFQLNHEQITKHRWGQFL